MINEKELRVGNIYLSKRNKDVLVKGIDSINKLVVIEEPDIDSGKEQPYIFEDLNPVPITRDILLKLGFKKENGGPETLHRKVDCEKDCAMIVFDHDGCFLKDSEYNKIGKQIEYVHQLQNIYYFLMGTELSGA
jgi:hypothetical protein